MHILIVEDERRLAHTLRRVLLEERHAIDVAYDGTSGLDLATSDTYDLVILDLMIPHIDELEVCRQMRANGITTPVLMLTARGAIEDRVKGLNIGADDYLVKPFAMEEFLARINALLRRRDRGIQANTELRVGNLTLDLVRHEACRDGHVIELTAKEFALLDYLMRHPGQVWPASPHMEHLSVAPGQQSDTGIGIAPEHLPHLGQRFYRVDKARSREGGGSGLGLSIAKNIAAAHHGSLTIMSKPGQGTTVLLSFPILRSRA